MQDEMNDLQMPYTDPNPGDLVRVVRCKNCRYWVSDGVMVCDRFTDASLKPDDYCSYGELRC